ncbi:MAG: YceI family protein [Ketobacteraceae bacterium]|nr:YceI family protein [Ketobacteraceae bacterium]
MRPRIFLIPLMVLLAVTGMQQAVAAPEKYIIDTKDAHAFIHFKIQHLGYSWLYGRFDKFDGVLMLDEKNPENSSIKVTVDTASINSNHAERDKHLRGEDFLDVKKYPTAEFVSTSVKKTGEKTGLMKGKLTLHGVTREIEIPIKHVGGGKDPWGGYRHGFTGSTTLKLKDYGIDYDLGPASTEVQLMLDIETIKQ